MPDRVDDTIAAVSTPAGHGLRAVVRLSGPDAVACVAGRFRPDDPACDWRSTFRVTPGRLSLAAGDLRVPSSTYVMRAPHSYTREDVVELHVPGSPVLLDMLLDDLLMGTDAAVRLAQPGEFTRRAFLNGRIDLSQAEAVLAVIRSRSSAELRAASERLGGSTSRRCAALQQAVTDLRVQIEAALDFSQHGIELLSTDDFLERCRGIRREISQEEHKGRSDIASNGSVHVVIAGPPNAGKSSLLNRLARADRAIVHARAGTTRDPVGAEISVDGVVFRLSDTAGLVSGATGPDGEAVLRSQGYVGSCQILMLVLDGSEPLPDGALEPAAMVAPSQILCVINKQDLPQVLSEADLADEAADWEVLHVSARTGEGIDELRAALARVVTEGRLDASASDCLFNARQRVAVRQAIAELQAAEAAVEGGLGYEFAALNLREAASALGQVTGEVGSQAVLDDVFSRFCIGK